jgi:hypothetical protein
MRNPSWEELEAIRPDYPPEAEAIERSFVRTFGGNDGQRVLEYLRGRFMDRRYGADCSDATLRHGEGAREVVDTILSMIKRGMK